MSYSEDAPEERILSECWKMEALWEVAGAMGGETLAVFWILLSSKVMRIAPASFLFSWSSRTAK